MRFVDYDKARDYAQKQANTTGLSVGVERFMEYGTTEVYLVRFLPRADKRFGLDARVEAVEPERVTKLCRCGHPKHGAQCPHPDGCWCDTFRALPHVRTRIEMKP